MAKVFRIDKKLPITWQEALQSFLSWKQAQGVAPLTLRDYRLHITRFFKKFPDAYHPHLVRERVLAYMSEPLMPASFNRRRQYLLAFFSWAVREGIFPQNPLHDIHSKRDKGTIRHQPEEVLKNLLELPNKTTFTGLRDYALILLMISTGIRPGEALALLPQHVNLKALTIVVERTVAKTRVERILPLDPRVASALEALLKARHPAWDEKVPVFCTWEGRPLRVNDWDKRMEKYGKKLGMKITPYQLRHSFATLALKSGANAFAIQAIMGHSDLRMTLRYVHLLESDLREAMMKSNPLNRIMHPRGRVGKVQNRH